MNILGKNNIKFSSKVSNLVVLFKRYFLEVFSKKPEEDIIEVSISPADYLIINDPIIIEKDSDAIHFIKQIVHHSRDNEKYFSEKNRNNFQKVIFQTLYNKKFTETMFSGEEMNTLIQEIQNEISHIIEENNKITTLIKKFSPPVNSIIPQDKIYLPKILTKSLLFNFLDNIYFCELLIQTFWIDQNFNAIVINKEIYRIYYATIWEDSKWIDIILYNWDKVIWLDITSHNKWIKTKRTKKGYDKIVVFRYHFYRRFFYKFMAKYNNYMIKGKEYPQLDLADQKFLINFKNDFSTFIEQYCQNNIISSADQDTDNNAVRDQF